MEILSLEEVISYLNKNKKYLHGRFGLIPFGIFGSFTRGEQTPLSDIDMVIETEDSKKYSHFFVI